VTDVPTIGGLNGAVAVVTGGASGIGAACGRLLERSGAAVIVADLAGEPAVDVTDRDALDRLASSLDRVDVLINAAGVLTENKPVDELAPDDFRRSFEVNVLGTVNSCQAFTALLRASRGAVVNVASQAALVSLPQQAAYSASKGADAVAGDRLGRPRRARECRRSRLHRHAHDGGVLRERHIHEGCDGTDPARPPTPS